MKAHVLLRRGAARIRRFGWIREHYGDRTYGFCAIGSMLARPDLYPPPPPESSFLAAAIGVEGQRIGEVFAWNDYPGRTKEEVLAALEDAARIAESAELTDRHWPEVG